MTQNFRYGGNDFPLPSSTANSLLRDADRPLFFALDFLSAMITAYAGDRLIAEAALCGAPINNAVESRLPYDAGPYLVEQQIALPALTIARQSGKSEYKTVSRAHEITTWTASYILPSLSAAQAQRLMPILHAVQLLIENRLEQGWDPTYAPPGLALGDEVWKVAGVETVDLLGCTYGGFQGMGDLFLPALVMNLQVKERNEPASGDPFQGLNVTIGIGQGG